MPFVSTASLIANAERYPVEPGSARVDVASGKQLVRSVSHMHDPDRSGVRSIVDSGRNPGSCTLQVPGAQSLASVFG